MHYVILRDDDTNALTPVECLEQLYRPFLDRGLPVNLATIPRVRTDTLRADGQPEGFLFGAKHKNGRSIPLTENGALVRYLHENPGFHVVQHGYHHTLNEFDSENSEDMRHRLERGRELLAAAGFNGSGTFVAPYDNYFPISVQEIARQFRIFSTGWFELRRLPTSWWTRYAMKKLLHRPHWRMGPMLLLSHPGCLLSRERTYAQMLDGIKNTVAQQQLTVLVTHWWEYFRAGKPDETFIRVLHQTAEWLAGQRNVKVISFDDLLTNQILKAA